ncbi:hypothetical protein AYL99_00946 [Fonsecaea erecta]|uniref:Uncharacterized protein n=1 Tax=Fonsecaea erecta TaxID=1367422 RepID=A0A178ZYQ5_9EURO|nr:hypothetical protein AYL99_00946 [Fonsecaea erecta]OAP64974.1 hypothetical protein AYL99_00946 [Fonsecaea erecta]
MANCTPMFPVTKTHPMAAPNEPIHGGSSTSGLDLVHGWVGSPNIRGTADIVKSCVVTLGLCSWSVLCLNVPDPTDTVRRCGFLRVKLWWTMVALVFPEVVTGVAGEQWRAATQCKEDFVAMGFADWSMRMAFFANMGGFMLKAPDFPEFPINGQQLAYLIQRKYVALPDSIDSAIRDKNKADGFARMVTVVQMVWFMLQCLGRAFQSLGLSTLELTVVANIFGTICSFAFWAHKPLDVESHVVLTTTTPMATILVEAGDVACKPYSRTPLDFVKPARTRPNLTTTCWLGVQTMFNAERDPPGRPIRSIGNTETLPAGSYHKWDVCFFVLFPLLFFGLHGVAWWFTFPTPVEALLWKIATVSLLSINVLHYGLVYTYIYHPKEIGMAVAGRPTRDIWEFYEVAPRWLIYSSHWFGMLIYMFARLYILVEGWSGLRSLQSRLYRSVDWSNYIPHY